MVKDIFEGAWGQFNIIIGGRLISRKTATADKPFNPTKSLLSRIAKQTNASTYEYQEILKFITSQLLRSDSKWRRYFRTLVVVEYLLYFGNQRCVEWAVENLHLIKVLELFEHADKKAELKVRYAAKQVVFLLSNEKRLLREREKRNNWISTIPDIRSSEASFTSPTPIPLAFNWETGAAERPQKAASKEEKSQKESAVEKHPPFLTDTFDRRSSPLPIKEAPVEIWEKTSVPVLHSQEPYYPRDQLPDAQKGPRIMSNFSSQSTAPDPGANPFPRISFGLQSSSAVPEITETSRLLAIEPTVGEYKLGDYFPSKNPHTKFTDAQCQDIARLLCESGKDSWSRMPRMYIILRIIDQLQVLDGFIDQGINDLWLPFTESSLPRVLSAAYHPEFIATQPLVLTKALDLENTKGHAHFTRGDPFPFEIKGELGRGGFGVVDRVLSPLSGREFARKRFKRGKNIRRAELDSFMNELQILKRLSHIHCVKMIASYTEPKYFGIIMLPVADCDLDAFYLSLTAEKAPLLRTFFGCLAGALDHLHEVKIRHRDIKPKNILIKGSRVYLADFGISLDWENLSRSTTTEDTAKTRLYCAPEVARFEKRNTSSDIWSLGCVFVEMLTLIKGRTIEEQRQFFEQRTENYRFYENISGIQEWVRQLRQIDSNQTSDSFIADCILRLLKENPAERLSTQEMYNKISNYQGSEKEKGNPLCGECCVSDTFSVSDSGSDRDPFSDTIEP